jgi:catalase
VHLDIELSAGSIAAGLGQADARSGLAGEAFLQVRPEVWEGVAKALGRRIEEIVKKEDLATA